MGFAEMNLSTESSLCWVVKSDMTIKNFGNEGDSTTQRIYIYLYMLPFFFIYNFNILKISFSF